MENVFRSDILFGLFTQLEAIGDWVFSDIDFLGTTTQPIWLITGGLLATVIIVMVAKIIALAGA